MSDQAAVGMNSDYGNEDLAVVPRAQRTGTRGNYVALCGSG